VQVILALGLSVLHILFFCNVTIDFYVYYANKIIKSNQIMNNRSTFDDMV